MPTPPTPIKTEHNTQRTTPNMHSFLTTTPPHTPIFATGGNGNKIDLYSNRLSHLGSFRGHTIWKWITCLAWLPGTELMASASDHTIKVWNLCQKTLFCTIKLRLKDRVTAVCMPRRGIVVSASKQALYYYIIIWDISDILNITYKYLKGNLISGTPQNPGASHSRYAQFVSGHESKITELLRINDHQIISSEFLGDFRVWDIDTRTCLRHISRLKHGVGAFRMMKHFKMHPIGDMNIMAYSKKDRVYIWGTHNSWSYPIKKFKFENHITTCFELLTNHLFVVGKTNGQMEIIDMLLRKLVNMLDVHRSSIKQIIRIAKNIVLTLSMDKPERMKIVDPLSGECFYIYDELGPNYVIVKLF